MRFLTTLNKIEDELVREIVGSQKRYIDSLASKLASGQTLTPKTLQWKLKTASERSRLLQEDFRKYYFQFFDSTLDQFLKLTAEEIGTGQINFDAVPWDKFKALKDGGLEFMKNYADTVQKKVRSQLYIAMLNGENCTDAWLRIKPIGNERARPKIMVRDQISRVAQRAIMTGYSALDNPDDFLYWWTGPDDSRTTEECRERKAKNPYTYDEMKKLPYHPHIQCRHRWVAKRKQDQLVIKEELKNSEKKTEFKLNHQYKMDEYTQKQLIKYEDQIKNMDTEKAVAFDDNGNVIMDKSGTSSSVSFTLDEIRLLKGKASIFTHNHPGSSSFSMEDFIFGNQNQTKRVRVTSQYFDYEIYFNQYLDPNRINDLKMDFKDIKNKWGNAFSDKFINIDKILTEKAEKDKLLMRYNQIISHLTWKEVSKKYPEFTYKRWVR